MWTINSVFILRKSVNYSVNLFSNRNVNSTNDTEHSSAHILLHNSETRTTNAAVRRRIEVLKMACLQKTEGVIRQDRIQNVYIQRMTEIRKYSRYDYTAMVTLQ